MQNSKLLRSEATQGCGGTAPPCCHNVDTQMLKEPLQRAALDIALGARAVKSSVQTLNTQDLIQDLRQ